MAGKLLAHLRGQWIGVIALLLVLTGGTAYALEGSNTVFTDDIVNGDVKVADIGQGAVTTDEIANNQVKAVDIGDGEVKSADVANGQLLGADIGAGEVKSGNVANDNLTGGDISPNSLKGADIDESTLDVGDAARAYARVSPVSCSGTPGTCTPDKSKGISSVTRPSTGHYCITAPGIDPAQTPAAVTVDYFGTSDPRGNASAMAYDPGCGATGESFRVITERQPEITVDAGGGINNRTAAGSSAPADNVAFTVVIP